MKLWEKVFKALKAPPLYETSFPLHEMVEGLLLADDDIIEYELCICLKGSSTPTSGHSVDVESKATALLENKATLFFELTYNEHSEDWLPKAAQDTATFENLVRIISEQIKRRNPSLIKPLPVLRKSDGI
jgi:hypothetical protein